MINSVGLYIHIPFCASKCRYCSFYSGAITENLANRYSQRLIKEIEKQGDQLGRPVHSVYFGGGTPTQLGYKRLSEILNAVFRHFSILPDAEITLEANPSDNLSLILPPLIKFGVNRLSLGLQSADDNELKILGRRHQACDVKNSVKIARELGIANISLDIMLGLPESSTESLKKSLDFAVSLNPEHISAYILKLEKDVPLYGTDLPDDDNVAEQYLYMCRYLKNAGFEHYEISNFAKSGFKAQHNTSYWQLKEYLGFGPSAHSHINGQRYFYRPDINEYIKNPIPCPDGIGGTAEEYIMLGLRLSCGISGEEFFARFGKNLPDNIYKIADKLQKNGLANIENGKIRLTDSGMLVSNSIINLFVEELEQ